MKGYNKIKDAMIAGLTAYIYYNVCVPCNDELFPVVVGTIGMFCITYCVLRDADMWIAKKAREMRVCNDVH